MPNLLVLSAAVGAGHLRAAQALEQALKELAPQAHVQNVDVLTLTNTAFRKLYGQAYLDLVNRAPHMLGYLYDFLDRPVSKASARRDRFRLLVQKANLAKFRALLDSKPWDLILNTHYLPAELVADRKRTEAWPVPQWTITTDFDTHRLWKHLPCERYTTATDEGAAYLASMGVPRETIHVTGIPIHPLFAKPKTRAEAVAELGLRGDRPILLQLAGGFGVGPLEQIYTQLLELERPLEIVVVCGKNAKLKAQLERVAVPRRHAARVMGFTDKMDALLAAADLVLSKPGGLTTSEILARGAALAILNPIPGQETRNSDYLLEAGAAIKINNPAILGYKLSKLFDDPDRLIRLKRNAKRLGKPRAAYEIASAALASLRTSAN
ncbi:MAG: UDP-N-acetylglucosamine--LPS N-acetylglucosamine transferase [Planctomycetes bacterium]|nr:UDP-N-acetylglucosamine--LPS N-acetylglucosamine transferase [Planctomycetota bacterium]